MALITRDDVELDLPFTETEYRDRARRVREEMGRRDVEVLLVLSPANLCYLTGFESIWYPPRAPVGAVVAREDERLLFVDYDRHRTLVERVALFDDAVFYDYATAIDQLCAAFVERGWSSATIGVERWTASPARRWSTGSRRRSLPPARAWWPATGSSTACAWSSRRRSWPPCDAPLRSSTPPSSRWASTCGRDAPSSRSQPT